MNYSELLMAARIKYIQMYVKLTSTLEFFIINFNVLFGFNCSTFIRCVKITVIFLKSLENLVLDLIKDSY